MRVNWTETAIEHLSSIYEYVAQNSPSYAQRIVDQLTRRAQQISQFPNSGRAVPELDLPQVREVIEGPYRIIYRILPDRIDVLAVLHGAQQTPWDG
ncbi:type II toxin-antitoxin system mRNA interferase toxin, RelE/StbE family [soil metagenome]